MTTFKSLLESQEPIDEAKFQGLEILPNWLGKNNFGKPLKSIRDLKEGGLYILWEGGMDEWHGEYKYSFDKRAKEYLFDDASQPFPDPYAQMTFTKSELEDYISKKLIYNQI